MRRKENPSESTAYQHWYRCDSEVNKITGINLN